MKLPGPTSPKYPKHLYGRKLGFSGRNYVLFWLGNYPPHGYWGPFRLEINPHRMFFVFGPWIDRLLLDSRPQTLSLMNPKPCHPTKTKMACLYAGKCKLAPPSALARSGFGVSDHSVLWTFKTLSKVFWSPDNVLYKPHTTKTPFIL